MKKVITFLILTFTLIYQANAQTESQKTMTEETGVVIQMNKQMFLDKVFDYTTGSTDWKYKGDKPAIIDFYATWCGPCRMISPIMKELAKEYKDQITVYKVDTDKEKELSVAMGIQSLPTVIFIPQTGQPQIIVGAADKDTFKRAVKEVLLKP